MISCYVLLDNDLSSGCFNFLQLIYGIEGFFLCFYCCIVNMYHSYGYKFT